jgi:hypothetical protein
VPDSLAQISRGDGASADAAFSRGLLDPDAPMPSVIKGLTPKRYAVYRNNVTVSLVRAMEANFPAIRRLLGETYFAGFAREFVQANPPQSPLMFFYGDAFPDYLAAQNDLAEFPYLADVARLEQQWRISYHAADDVVLDATALSSLAPEQLPFAAFVPHPAFAVLRSAYALHDVFTVNRGDENFTVDPADPQDVLVTRPQFDVLVNRLPLGGAVFFRSLAQGQCLGEAAENAVAHAPEFNVASSLALMIQAGAFKSVSIIEE